MRAIAVSLLSARRGVAGEEHLPPGAQQSEHRLQHADMGLAAANNDVAAGRKSIEEASVSAGVECHFVRRIGVEEVLTSKEKVLDRPSTFTRPGIR